MILHLKYFKALIFLTGLSFPIYSKEDKVSSNWPGYKPEGQTESTASMVTPRQDDIYFFMDMTKVGQKAMELSGLNQELRKVELELRTAEAEFSEKDKKLKSVMDLSETAQKKAEQERRIAADKIAGVEKNIHKKVEQLRDKYEKIIETLMQKMFEKLTKKFNCKVIFNIESFAHAPKKHCRDLTQESMVILEENYKENKIQKTEKNKKTK